MAIGFDHTQAVLKVRSYKSGDGGASWTFDSTPSGAQTNADREVLWVDHSPTSPFRDQIYVTWHGGNPAFVARRTAGAAGGWQPPVQVSGAETTGTAIGGDVKTNSSGDLFVFWPDTGGSRKIYVVKSTDGGATFNALGAAPVVVAPIFASSLDISIPSDSQRKAEVYVSGGVYRTATKNLAYAIWVDLNGGAGCNSGGGPGATVASSCKTRIWFARSTDGGVTWPAPPIRIKPNASSLSDQFNPRLCVDETTGTLVVVYHDTVNDPGRLKTDVFVQRSFDDGASWTAAIKLTSAPTDETSAGADPGNSYGDYLGLSGHDGKFFAAWTDRRSGGKEEIWGAPIRTVAHATNTTSGTGSFVIPTAVLALANKRIRDLNEALSRKLDATTVNAVRGFTPGLARSRFGPTERRVLGIVRQAADVLSGRDQAPTDEGSVLGQGPSRFAVLGTAGFELPSYADEFSAAGSWRADTLRRASPDPNFSLVVVPTTQFAIRAGERGVADAGANAVAADRARAFSLGLLSAVAANVVVGPVQRGIFNRATRREWARRDPGPELTTADSLLLSRLIGGSSPAGRWQTWWPAATEVPDAIYTGYLKSLDEAYALDKGAWPSVTKQFESGAALDLARLKAGYARMRADQATSTWSALQWWGVLSPMLIAPSLSLALARLVPGANRFFTPGRLTERSFSQLFTLTQGIASIPPFIYSMILWSQIPEHTEVFANSLVLFLVRAGLMGGWFATIGTDSNDPSPAARWILAALQLVTDGYALIRGLAALNDRQRGNSLVYFLNALPGATALATVGLAALLKAIGLDSEAGSWIAWGVLTAGLLVGAGIPISIALAHGGGYLSWFRTDAHLNLQSALGALDPATPEPAGPAATFDDSTLWFDLAIPNPTTPRPNLADLHYPSGPQPIVKLWWEGAGELFVAHDDNLVRFRQGTGGAVTPVTLNAGQRTSADLVAALTAALPGLHAEPSEDAPGYDLPWPQMLSDPGDEQADNAGHEAHKGDFVKVGTNPDHAYLLRQAPRSELLTSASLRGPAASRFDDVRLVPNAELGDLDDTAIGTAADLAVLLSLAALPSLRTVNPTDPGAAVGAPPVPGPIGPVYQVFRQWNLDERRVNEWRMLVAGGAVSEKNGHPADRDPGMRPDPNNAAYNSPAPAGEPLAMAMGWLPLWRAWVRVASDTTADAEAATTMPYTPTVIGADGRPRRPTNRDLTTAVRFLLDLPA